MRKAGCAEYTVADPAHGADTDSFRWCVAADDYTRYTRSLGSIRRFGDGLCNCVYVGGGENNNKMGEERIGM